jgi:hypothetical protein
MSIFSDILIFIKSLSFVDIVFLVAVILLLILIVTLLYFIKINKDEINEDDLFSQTNKKNEVKENHKEDLVDKIVRENTEEIKEEEFNDEEGELLDLESLTQKLKEEQNTDQTKIDKYEQEQEEKAIISYDELLKKNNHYALNYEKEEVVDDLIIKKVNLNDLVNKDVEENVNNNVRVISYQKEEDFLKALKELNSLLN